MGALDDHRVIALDLFQPNYVMISLESDGEVEE